CTAVAIDGFRAAGLFGLRPAGLTVFFVLATVAVFLATFARSFLPAGFFRTAVFVAVLLAGPLIAFVLPVVFRNFFAIRFFFRIGAGFFFLGVFFAVFFAIRLSQYFPSTSMNQFLTVPRRSST